MYREKKKSTKIYLKNLKKIYGKSIRDRVDFPLVDMNTRGIAGRLGWHRLPVIWTWSTRPNFDTWSSANFKTNFDMLSYQHMVYIYTVIVLSEYKKNLAKRQTSLFSILNPLSSFIFWSIIKFQILLHTEKYFRILIK